MPPIKWPRMTLLGRIALFLAVFGAAIALQIGIGYYQSKYVRSGTTQTISQFLNDVEGCMAALENYRWDYGDAAALIASIQSSREHSAGHLALIRADLGAVSEEQYLLASAARTTYGTLDLTLGAITEELRSGRPDQASRLYYGGAEPCGAYLRQYTQQLLEQACSDSQEAHVRLTQLNETLKRAQTAVVLVCVAVGTMLVVSLVRLLRSVAAMAQASQAISRGEFDVPDLDGSSRDETGHMARAFNEMKHSMRRQVELLNEKSAVEKELHAKEMEALELQNLMEREKLQQLRSQINPHFLFNTLNGRCGLWTSSTRCTGSALGRESGCAGTSAPRWTCRTPWCPPSSSSPWWKTPSSTAWRPRRRGAAWTSRFGTWGITWRSP